MDNADKIKLLFLLTRKDPLEPTFGWVSFVVCAESEEEALNFVPNYSFYWAEIPAGVEAQFLGLAHSDIPLGMVHGSWNE